MAKQNRQPLVADLRNASFDEWLNAVFNHAARAGRRRDVHKAWYMSQDVEFIVDPARQIRFLTQLFEAPEILPQRYSTEQIEEGFWFMFSAIGKEWFRDALWNSEVPWAAREACIQAVPTLYERLFTREEDADGVAWMLWDLIAFDYDCGNRDPAASEEDRRVQDAMLDAMRRMLLGSDSSLAQSAALHGLFHLNHRNGPELIRHYLKSRRIGLELRSYAQNVLAGRAL